MNDRLISFVVPVMNEECTIVELYDGIAAEIKNLGRQLQVIFIDDGSTDMSWSIVQKLAQEHPDQVQGIRFRRNLGKAAALAAGFRAAKGAIVFTMDADLQDDPKEISRFIAKLDEGFEVVSGWKKKRHDPWHKVLPSRVFNKMLSAASGVLLHDHNCGFKAYRAQVVTELNLYGEMHRMMPSLAGIRGFKSSEIEVEHHARQFGQSKYGVKRFLRGFMDMTTIWFLRQYRERPLHLLGGLACTALIGGVGSFALSLLMKGSIASEFAFLGTCLAVAALPLMAIGFLAELMVSYRTVEDRNLPILEETGAIRTTLEIPAVPTGVAPRLVSPEEPSQDAPVVLISDDDPAVRRLLAYHLEGKGYNLIFAHDGPETLEKISMRPAVVLLDLMLPGVDGMHCLKQIRAFSADTKVIMVSGHGQINQAVGAMKIGAYDYITKPFEPEQIISAVRRAIEQQKLAKLHSTYAA